MNSTGGMSTEFYRFQTMIMTLRLFVSSAEQQSICMPDGQISSSNWTQEIVQTYLPFPRRDRSFKLSDNDDILQWHTVQPNHHNIQAPSSPQLYLWNKGLTLR